MTIPMEINGTSDVLGRIFMITERLLVFDDLDDVFSHIVKTTVTLTRADAASIRVFNMGSGMLEIVKAYGVSEGYLNQPPMGVGEGVIGCVVETGEPFSTTDILTETRCNNKELAELEGVRSLVAVPMKSRSGTIGCITAYRRSVEPFSPQDLLMLNLFSAESVEAVEKARLIEELRKQATLDTLTGLFNRRVLMERLETEAARARRHGQEAALMFLDVDDFKAFNDSEGHLLGDKALHDIAGIMQESCRRTEVLGRYGGEELVVVAAQTTEKGAVTLAEKLRRRVERHRFRGRDGERKLTCSVGVALIPLHGTDPATLMERADQAMYQAKREGKNRVVVYAG